MSEFDAIRPYEDDEVPAVVARLVRNKELRRGVAAFVFPKLHPVLPVVAETMVAGLLRWRARDINNVLSFQMQMRRYLDFILRTNVRAMTFSGLEGLEPGKPCLFISNHRDIVLDSGLINRILHNAGHDTCRLAVGDNLFSTEYAADIMRVNKAFMVERSVTGTKAQFKALSRTARYIRHSLESGQHVWIAQRGGRSKDGFDRTDPALLKMLALAYRKELGSFGELAERMCIIPTSISYELDPCDLRKAEELALTERDGDYAKSADDDLQSIGEGLTGFKGRMHYHFGRLEPGAEPGALDSAEAMATAIDREIVGHLNIYPTHALAAQELGIPIQEGVTESADMATLAQFKQRLEQCPTESRPFLLAQYGNLVRNRNELDLPVLPKPEVRSMTPGTR
ncbi:MAG: 1-acyl-sn-glycerol-3-phosphate acyltransferase [Pseudomonadales bacterium]